MNRITKKQLSQLEEEAKMIITCLADDRSIDDILADMYVRGIDGASYLQGLTGAARVIYEIKSFDQDYYTALENRDEYLYILLWRLAHGMNLKERCNFWAAVTNTGFVIVLKGMGKDAEADRVIEETPEEEFIWEVVSQELEDQLKELAKKAIENSGIMLAALSEQIKSLETIDNAKEETQLLLYYTQQEVEFRAVAAMLAYIKIKNGEFRNISVDITLPQAAALGCAATEHIRINVAVKKKMLPKERAAEMLTLLGMYVLGTFLVKLAAEGFAALLPYFGLVRSASACISAFIVLFYVFARVYDKAENTCRKMLDFSCAALGEAVRGAKKMFKYMKHRAAVWHEDQIRENILEFEEYKESAVGRDNEKKK